MNSLTEPVLPAHETLVFIMRSAVSEISPSERERLCARLDAAFDIWKLQQCDDDGYIALLVDPETGRPFTRATSHGLISDFDYVRRYKEATSQKFPIRSVKAYECAGPSVGNAADLLLRLYVSGFVPIKKLEDEFHVAFDRGLVPTCSCLGTLSALLSIRHLAETDDDSLANVVRILIEHDRAAARVLTLLVGKLLAHSKRGYVIKKSADVGREIIRASAPIRTARDISLAQEFRAAKERNPNLSDNSAAENVAGAWKLKYGGKKISYKMVERAAKKHGDWGLDRSR